MPGIAAFLSAAAAITAAVLAGLNLRIAGKREVGKWLRESLVDAFVEFLDASFACKDHCKKSCNGLRAGVPEGDRKEALESADQAAETMLKQLTRLRLLAPDYVVAACKDLHRRNLEFLDLAHHKPDGVRDLDDLRLRDQIRDARNAAVVAGKRVMRIA